MYVRTRMMYNAMYGCNSNNNNSNSSALEIDQIGPIATSFNDSKNDHSRVRIHRRQFNSLKQTTDDKINHRLFIQG